MRSSSVVVIRGNLPAGASCRVRVIGEKQYDRDYFDRWYRRGGFGTATRVERKLGYAVASAEYLLDRRVRTVLDVGCGEGRWGVELRKLRPAARYVGIDPSAYAVERYGRKRGVRAGGFGDLPDLVDELGGPFDLVVCCDVLPYVGPAELRQGLTGLGDLVGGVAFLEVWTASDDVEGDLEGFRRRTATTYERWFAGAGLRRIGPHLYVPRPLLAGLATLERPPGR
jgi:predicted TPR repeat methyltransferase